MIHNYFVWLAIGLFFEASVFGPVVEESEPFRPETGKFPPIEKANGEILPKRPSPLRLASLRHGSLPQCSS